MSFFTFWRRRKNRQVASAREPRRTQLALERLEDRSLLSVNPIVAENQLPGTPQSVWDISGVGDTAIQGFATDISVNRGQTVNFKITDTANAPYHIEIYRMGYYGGMGARLVDTIASNQTIKKNQPAPLRDNSVGLVDAGNWSVTASWAVPANATSGIYFGKVIRDDTGGASHIVFIVRDDASHSDVLFQASDTTWQAYNSWGGSSLYHTTLSNLDRAYKVSYNRPFDDRGTQGGDGDTNWVFYAEYPMVRWLEANGYDVSYFTDTDADRLGSLIQQHKLFMSTGHDEYWSGGQRANVEAARDAGVNLAFFSGNSVFWKTRWENSIDGSGSSYRTLVTYKETKANAQIDPAGPATWTGTWMDPRFSPPGDGGRPQNALMGTLFTVNRGVNDTGSPFTVPYAYGQMRLWRNTTVAGLQPGQTATLGDWELGYEWDEDVDNGFRPAGLIDLSSTTQNVTQKFTDYGNSVQPGTATHSLTLYRAPSGALVFGGGMVQWSWGLDGTHDGPASVPVAAVRQATVNLFADMYIQPATPQAGIVTAIPSADGTAPTSTVTSPSAGQGFVAGTPVTITGTATDIGGVVAGIEVSTDGGLTWHKATGMTSWTYTWTPDTPGPAVIMSRATDDSVNTERPASGVSVSVSLPAPTSTAGLVAAYNFNQGSGSTLTDVSGHGNNGTILLGAGSWTTGVFGGALSFDGSTTWVTVADNASLRLTSGMTLESWVYPTATTVGYGSIISKERSGGLDYSLYASEAISAHPAVYTQNSATPTAQSDGMIGASTLPTNTWTHLAATYDGSVLRLYVNGVLQVSEGLNYSFATSTQPLRIGGNNIFGDYFQGLMDEVRIYNRPLTTGEIRSDMSTPWAGSLDATAPAVTLTGPTNGATVSGVVTLAATASDNVAVANVQFLLDGAKLGPPDPSRPYSLSWDSRTVANGSHTLSARVTDMAGNVTTSGTVTVTVNNAADTTGPTARIMGPSAGTEVSGSVILAAFASDNVGVASVQFLLNGVNAGPAVTTAPYRLAFDTHAVASGSYSLTAVARDLAGNTTTSAPVTLSIDNLPPTVSNQTPAPGAADVSTATALTVTFSKAVQSSTISFVLKDAANNAVPAVLTYNSTTMVATLTPGNVLATSSTYTATVSGATDLIGNVMAAPVSWSFTTSALLTGATIFGNATPAVASVSDPNAVEVGVKFRSDVPGTITGLRFYKGAANTGTHVGHLWTSSGTLLGTATFSGESASGWQQVTFATPVSINPNTTYVASYYAPVGGYAANNGFFTSSGFDNGPLHALADGVDGPNGLYRYGTGGGFPGTLANGANYWVDIIFNASSASTLPSVTAQTPAPNATEVATNTTVTATFSMSVQSSSIAFALKDAGNNAVAAAVSYNDTTHTATLTPTAALAAGATYTATVSGATDATGHTMAAPVSWSFKTASDNGNQNNNPSGVTIWASTATPAVASANDPNPVEVGVKFRSDVAGTVTGLRFYKGPSNTGTHVGHLWTGAGALLATATFSGESASGWQQVTFLSPVTISANTTYVASYYAPAGGYAANSGYFTSAGADNAPLHALANGVDGPNGVYTYGTGGGFPSSASGSANYWVDVVFSPASAIIPVVTAQTPAPNAAGVPVSTTVTATFSESVTAASISFVLKDAGNNAVAAAVSYNDTTHTATLTPTAALAAGATYTATVSGATDATGHTMAAPVSWSFTTAATATSGVSIWSSTATPAVASVNDPNPVELGVKFRADTAGFITGLRFYKGPSNTGIHVGHLWTSSGTLLATATFSNESASGWQQVTFSSPVAVSANTTYVASYYAPAGGYAANSSYFASIGVDNPPLHALRNGVDGGNGVYRYGSGGGFPGSTYSSSNYWVDVVFSPSSTGTAPTVTAQTPSPNATGVPVGTTVTATFSVSVTAASINFVLKDPGGNTVPAAVSYNDTTHSVTLTPSAPLAGLTTYTALLSGATDAGGSLMTPASWSFTTTGASIWSASTTPATASVNDNNAVEVGVKFRADVAGVITGLRFYKGPSNTGTHVGHLWTSSGTLLATATFSGESASGWQQVNFATPVSINPNTTYIASYYAPVGGYAANGGFFTSSGTDNGVLHALANGVDGPNGLYRYIAGGGFPTQSFNAANYWVDVVFLASSSSAPTVTAQTPAPGAAGVSATTAVTATFNAAIQAGSLSFVLKDGGGNPVAATVSYNSTTFTATLTPNAALSSSATYTATVSASSQSGTPMAAPLSWSFTTMGAWQQTTAADFSAGTLNGTVVTNTSGGELQLAPGFTDDFSAGALGSAWTSAPWVGGGGGSTAGSVLTVSGAEVLSAQAFVDVPVEGSLNFAAAPYQHFGLATDLASVSGNSWAIFSTSGTADTLYARVNAAGVTQDVSLGALPVGFHVYRVQPVAGGFQFWVDGVLKTTVAASVPAGTPLKIALSSYLTGASALRADWVRQMGGTFTSTVFDATRTASWGTVNWTANLPAGTTMIVQTRSGSTLTPDGTWSGWAAVSNGGTVASPSSRYLQYRVIFTTTDPALTPVLQEFIISWS